MTNPLFHEDPSTKEHLHYCFRCIFYEAFRNKKKTPSYPIEAYRLLADMIAMSIFKKHRGLRPGMTATCKEVLDDIPENAGAQFGELAPMVFDVLGLRTTKDLDRIVTEGLSVKLFANDRREADRFSDYDLNILELLRQKSAVKGSS